MCPMCPMSASVATDGNILTTLRFQVKCVATSPKWVRHHWSSFGRRFAAIKLSIYRIYFRKFCDIFRNIFSSPLILFGQHLNGKLSPNTIFFNLQALNSKSLRFLNKINIYINISYSTQRFKSGPTLGSDLTTISCKVYFLIDFPIFLSASFAVSLIILVLPEIRILGVSKRLVRRKRFASIKRLGFRMESSLLSTNKLFFN